jgi:hypothetical protein
MVLHPANDNRLTIQFRQNSAEVVMHFIAKPNVAKKWTAFFGGEDCVYQDFCKRLTHSGVRYAALIRIAALSGLPNRARLVNQGSSQRRTTLA